MFYKPKEGHGLPRNPFNAVVSPRPIAWVSTRGSDGSENLAPYSFFNAVAYEPPQIMIASIGSKPDRDSSKDTFSNIRETGDFCINVVEYAMRDAMNKSSHAFERTVDEFAQGGLERTACEVIACSRVAGAPASLECKFLSETQLSGEANFVIFGEVVGVHLRDDCLADGIFDVTSFSPLARLGYDDYASIQSVFSLGRPKT